MTELFFLTVITALWCFTANLFFFFSFFENISASAVQNVFPQGTAGAVCVSQAEQGFRYFARTSSKIAEEVFILIH